MAIARERRPDLIVMDLRMPEMSGFEAARAIRQSRARAGSTGAASASTADLERAEAQRNTFTTCLRKPFQTTDLIDTIERSLGLKWRHVGTEALAATDDERARAHRSVSRCARATARSGAPGQAGAGGAARAGVGAAGGRCGPSHVAYTPWRAALTRSGWSRCWRTAWEHIAMPLPSEPYGTTLLIVDDKPQNLRLISDFLAEHGFDLMLTRSGAQALEKVRLATPDLVLLDVRMPEMDGFEVCRRLKRIRAPRTSRSSS